MSPRVLAMLLRPVALRTGAAGGLVFLVCLLLVLTIYFTWLDIQWLAFLGGVLLAAVLALASQVSKAEGRAARRTKQLQKYREQA